MDFSELVKIRQSDRKYSDRAIEKEKIEQCVNSARLAPSACNAQPWKFIVVNDPGLKEQIADSAASLGINKFTFDAPVIVAVVQEKKNILSYLGSTVKKKDFSLLDIGIAVSHFCLQAADLGLGTCIIGWFDEKRIMKLLNIESSKRIQLLITLGYSDSATRNKTRKSMDEMSGWNIY